MSLTDKLEISSKDNKSLDNFSRVIKTHEYYFKNGMIVFKTVERKCKFLSKIKGSINMSSKFLTMDLETRVINTKMSPYCVSMFDGIIKKSFYLSENGDPDLMLKESIYYIMRKKYDQHKVFFHNFSHFDGIFLLRILSDLSDNIKPIIRDGRIIDLSFSFGSGKTKYKLHFRDSYLLLPAALRSLTSNFNVSSKSIFPYRFVNNENIPLDYKGTVPSFEYFDGITHQEYLEYCKNFQKKILRNLQMEVVSETFNLSMYLELMIFFCLNFPTSGYWLTHC